MKQEAKPKSKAERQAAKKSKVRKLQERNVELAAQGKKFQNKITELNKRLQKKTKNTAEGFRLLTEKLVVLKEQIVRMEKKLREYKNANNDVGDKSAVSGSSNPEHTKET